MHRYSPWTTALAALLSLGGVDASMPSLPQETPIGLMAAIGISPRPTDPPGLPAGLPRELMPRQKKTTLPLPPPGYYCGLVEGDPENLLTCVNARANCVHQGTAIGCCVSKNIQDCTNIPSTCVNSADACDAACKANTRVLKCTVSTEPYCGIYSFAGGSTLFGCRAFATVTSSVQKLDNYYSSVYGASWTTALAASTSSIIDIPTRSSGGVSTSSSQTSSTTASGSSSPSPDDNKTLSSGAIAGVVVGACAVVGIIVAFIIWFSCVRKKDKEATGPPIAPSNGPPPNQEQYTGQPPNPQLGYYAPVPQEQKPVDTAQPPSYGYEKPPPSPNMAEMPGSGPQPPLPNSLQSGQAADYYNQRASMGPPSPLSPGTISPGSPTAMHSTHAGPVPEQIYEMGPGR
ncbi:hypothetical protein LOZ65_003725 [Ophidiomyces ophidiicola]|nr:hypothetical protein LOZ65_003725 [Ophidiomyces ophidiicola]